MADKELGKLTPVELRKVWPNEASDFTPWLAREENLAILSDTLGIPLEFEAREKEVGSFEADMLCKDLDSGAWVLIENQLEQTNHTHLGQLLTYASGLEAMVSVWVAKTFREEHRSALDWLNKITDERSRFFGVEVELWRVGDSLPAPKFHIVASPNDWSRSVARAARAEAEQSEARKRHIAYWTAFDAVLSATSGSVKAGLKPQPGHWMNYSIGRSDFDLAVVAVRRSREIRAELYIKGGNAKAYFHLLEEQRGGVEKALGYELDWQELPDRKGSRIVVTRGGVDPDDEKGWQEQHKWLAARLNELHEVFADRVKALNADDWRPEPDSEGAAEG